MCQQLTQLAWRIHHKKTWWQWCDDGQLLASDAQANQIDYLPYPSCCRSKRISTVFLGHHAHEGMDILITGVGLVSNVYLSVYWSFQGPSLLHAHSLYSSLTLFCPSFFLIHFFLASFGPPSLASCHCFETVLPCYSCLAMLIAWTLPILVLLLSFSFVPPSLASC